MRPFGLFGRIFLGLAGLVVLMVVWSKAGQLVTAPSNAAVMVGVILYCALVTALVVVACILVKSYHKKHKSCNKDGDGETVEFKEVK